jgi:hypothetical protein
MSNKAKSMSSYKHIQKSQSIGQDGERRFYDSCKFANLKIQKTKKNKDINQHTDFIVNEISFDVKGMKDTNKQGNILLELKNVIGNIGWCNDKGLPDWIAFDFGIFFLNVKNSDLFKLTKLKCDLNKKVSSINQALYKGYTRKDRQDVMTLVSLKDVLVNCEHWILPYNEYKEPMDLL